MRRTQRHRRRTAALLAGGPRGPRALVALTGLALAAAACQSYAPAFDSLCAEICAQQQTCLAGPSGQSTTSQRMCEIECGNELLRLEREATPACHDAHVRLLVCLAGLDCAGLAQRLASDPRPPADLPCSRQDSARQRACQAVECVADDDCHGWERCTEGTCEPRPCNTAADCPEGVWCSAGACSPL